MWEPCQTRDDRVMLRPRNRRRGAATAMVAAIACSAFVACSSITVPIDAAPDSFSDTRETGSMDASASLPERVARMCLLLQGCRSYVRVGDCARQFLSMTYPDQGSAPREQALRWILCGLAGDCASFEACMLGGHPSTYCDTHPEGSCDGDTLVICAGVNIFLDCRLYGLRCVPTATSATCSSGATCLGTGNVEECQGNRLVACAPGGSPTNGADCSRATAGGVCLANGEHAACVPGSTCSVPDSSWRCDGNIAAWCYLGRDHRVDCTAVNNGRCVLPGSGVDLQLADSCVPPDAECDPIRSIDRCHGTSVEACVAGHWVTVDCRSIGFATCRDVGRGASCVP